MFTKWRSITVLAIAFLMAVSADAAGLLIADGGFGGVLMIKEHTVRVTINNGIAVTEVNQVFLNTEDRQLEALYTFPVPGHASVANFSMWINGKEMIGEVVEKERARQIYESYKQKRVDPGLLEQKDYKTFEMRVFPIGPGAEQRVRVTYYQELNHDNDWATYVYPLATVTHAGIDDRIDGKFALTVEVKSEIPIVKMESPSHQEDFVLTAHNESYHEASLEKTEGSLAQDVVLAYHLSRPRTGVDIIASRRSKEDGFFCMTFTAGEELNGQVDGMDYVFVMDISGSMAIDRKLKTSANAVNSFFQSLGKGDRFELIAFNVAPNALFEKLEEVSPESLERAQKYLDTQQARGGTVLRSAISTAYKYADLSGDRSLNVVILSDGLTEQSDQATLINMISQRPANTKVFCIGVGNEVNRGLLEQIAEESGGLASIISGNDDFSRQAKAFRRKLTKPVASNLSIEFPGADVYDLVPEKLPNLYHGTPVRVYGRYKGDGEVNMKLSATISGRELAKTMTIEFPKQDDDNPEVERMWAWHRIQQLQKEADRTGSRNKVKNEIVRLGEGFSIASEYTSFLVLENNAEYKRWAIERKNATRIERDRKARKKLRTELDALRMASLDKIGPLAKEEVKAAQQNPQTSQRNVMPQQNSVPLPSSSQKTSAKRGWDFDLPRGGGGGGAVDPLSLILICGAGTLGLHHRRKRNRTEK
jgi:Ca-activated chloride channel homolog